MVESVYLPALAVGEPDPSDRLRHPAFVRLTHWMTTVSFLALLVSGIAILLAHPRLYWGETGSFETPSLLDLPLPLVLVGQSGWGRSLHFLSAWGSVAAGVLYVSRGVWTDHFRNHILPLNETVSWSAIARVIARHVRFERSAASEAVAYNALQRVVYSAVVFVLFPLMIWTGLAMSPAITSVMPALVTAVGGHQSARTIHFFVGAALVAFVMVHVTMVSVSGFTDRTRAMVTGYRRATTGRR
jgi:thiosulfate reductase cytochrome b subunit